MEASSGISSGLWNIASQFFCDFLLDDQTPPFSPEKLSWPRISFGFAMNYIRIFVDVKCVRKMSIQYCGSLQRCIGLSFCQVHI